MTARWADFLYGLVGRRRTQAANRQLGCVLAAVAGAINAGGFLAVQRYTSHMTGIVSSVADDFAIGSVTLALAGVVALATFVSGAACTALLINWARRQRLHSKYALALMVEAALLLLFGLAGANLASFAHLMVPSTVLLLCFIMGLQNAIITKISGAEIRTTHMTGIATDIGIELGRLFYWNRNAAANSVHFVKANRDKLFIHCAILASFFAGGVVGALAFKAVGFAATIPIAFTLAVLALPPILVDLHLRRFGHRSAHGR
ncbi:YoaK family protein [Variovorax sp. J22R115]|uniref:YoaK family protein n=1 Tax=Variovorax sp. J22R115 TaxID=3053509 RepID=UPI0025774B0D|nr:YoaK family protein [Variovorax sp. J22R115]MDM0049979.1 YoaK family protein [Variovorax sp. J22R115]